MDGPQGVGSVSRGAAMSTSAMQRYEAALDAALVELRRMAAEDEELIRENDRLIEALGERRDRYVGVEHEELLG